MDLELTGRVAIVGGSSRGLGRACAERLAREGADVVLVATGAETLERTATEIREETGAEVLAVCADQSREGEAARIVRKTVERFGPVDILVNNTGGPPAGDFEDFADEDWQRAFEGTLLSVVRLCREVLSGMRERGWGRIVTNTSFTVREPADRLLLSNVFRVGVVALSKTLAREVAADGVTVNCVAPGAFETDRLRSIFAASAEATVVRSSRHRRRRRTERSTPYVPSGRRESPSGGSHSPRSSQISSHSWPPTGHLRSPEPAYLWTVACCEGCSEGGTSS